MSSRRTFLQTAVFVSFFVTAPASADENLSFYIQGDTQLIPVSSSSDAQAVRAGTLLQQPLDNTLVSMIPGADAHLMRYFPVAAKTHKIDIEAPPVDAGPVCKSARAGALGDYLSCLQREKNSFLKDGKLTGQHLRGLIARYNREFGSSIGAFTVAGVLEQFNTQSDGWTERSKSWLASVRAKCPSDRKERCQELVNAVWSSAVSSIGNAGSFAMTDRIQQTLMGKYGLERLVVVSKEDVEPHGETGHTIQKRKGSDTSLLNECSIGLKAKPLYERQAGVPGPCPTPKDDIETAFAPVIHPAMEHLTVSTYLDELRIEAVGRLMRSYADLIGEHMGADPQECSKIKSGMDTFRATAKLDPRSIGAKSRTPAYQQRMQAAAARIQAHLDAVRRKLDSITKYLNDGDFGSHRVPPLNPAWVKAEDELKKDIQTEIETASVVFPYLMVGHDPRKEIYEDLPMLRQIAEASPQTLDDAVTDARRRYANELTKNVSQFCDDANGVLWSELVKHKSIRDAVLKKNKDNKAYKYLQGCVMDKLGAHEAMREKANFALGAVCGFASAGPQIVVFGPACAAIFLGDSYNDKLDADRKLDFVNQCRLAGSNVCDMKDFSDARDAYDSAVTSMITNSVFFGIEAAGASVKLVQAIAKAGNYMKPAELKEAQTAIEALRAHAGGGAAAEEKRIHDAEALIERLKAKAPPELKATLDHELTKFRLRTEQIKPERVAELKGRYHAALSKFPGEERAGIKILDLFERENLSEKEIVDKFDSWYKAALDAKKNCEGGK